MSRPQDDSEEDLFQPSLDWQRTGICYEGQIGSS